jgi:hypothetical protein
LREQRKAVFLAQLLVPAGELELFAGDEGESSRKVNGIESA